MRFVTGRRDGRALGSRGTAGVVALAAPALVVSARGGGGHRTPNEEEAQP
ncbi:MAG TPA: hypothetical protein VM942_00510 [Acidimicrobiales bacterium]|nr:hypothetical protein [Acidimicrobiales bacterium]